MTGVRIAISVFLIVLLVLVCYGWVWTGAHQSPPKSTASHVVLGISALASLVGLVAIWRSPARRA